MRTGIHEALSLLAQAGAFFGRHYLVIALFSAPAALQRFVAVGGGGVRFGPLASMAQGVIGELATVALRLGLLAWLVATIFRGVPRADASSRLTHFVEAHAPMLLASAGLLVLLTLLANGIPMALRSGLVEPERKSLLAWELAIKNLTIIPFVMVWMVLLARVTFGGFEPRNRAGRTTPGVRLGSNRQGGV